MSNYVRITSGAAPVEKGETFYDCDGTQTYLVRDVVYNSKGSAYVVYETKYADILTTSLGDFRDKYYAKATHDLVKGDLFTIQSDNVKGIMFLYVSEEKVLRLGGKYMWTETSMRSMYLVIEEHACGDYRRIKKSISLSEYNLSVGEI